MEIFHPRWSPARVITGLLGIMAIAAGAAAAWQWWSDRGSPQPDVATETAEGPSSALFDSDSAVKVLEDAGWDPVTARTVIALNAPFLTVVAESSVPECEGVVRRLARLGDPRHAYARKRLETMPELAGLMANTLDAGQDGPASVATAIGSDAESQTLASLFAMSATGDDAVALAQVINRDRDLAVRLARLHDTNLLSWLEPRDMGEAKAAEVYRTWARRIIRDAVSANPEQGVEEAFVILSVNGDRVAEVIQTDSGFRDALVSRVYPVFRRVLRSVDDDGFSREVFLVYPKIWEFIYRYPQDAENLLKSVGPAAVDVLMDPQFAGCIDGLLDVLSFADRQVIDGLLDERISRNPRFAAFLERPLPPKTRVAALQRLAASPERANRTLEEWSAMTPGGVIDSVGEPAEGPVTWLPGYAAAVLLRKLAQGQPVTSLDAAFAAIDAIEVVFIAKGGGAALRAIATSTRKSAAKAALKKVGSGAAEQVAKSKSRELAPWTLRGLQKAAGQLAAAAREKLMVDITPVVRALYKRSGLNAKTFRYLDRLDPRIFMRKDRRVVFDLAGNHPLSRFMGETATNAGIDTTLQTEAAAAAGRIAIVEGPKAVEAARRNIAAWWLMVGDGMVERLAVAPAAP